MNDVRIYMNLGTPPYPFLREHAQARFEKTRKDSDSLIAELLEQQNASNGIADLVDGCPVHALREVLPDGSDLFIGDLSFKRSNFFHIKPEEASNLMEENESLPLGDPNIVWGIGGSSLSDKSKPR